MIPNKFARWAEMLAGRLLSSAGLALRHLMKRGTIPVSRVGNARFDSSGFRGRTTPFGPYGGLSVKEEAAEHNQERFEALVWAEDVGQRN